MIGLSRKGMKGKSMERIHKFELNGQKIVLDINSGSIFVFDDISYDIIDDFDKGLDYIVENYDYDPADIEEAYQEIDQLVKGDYLLTPEVKEGELKYNRENVVKSLCLHVSHDCDLNCRYCFASGGTYNTERDIMSYETGKKALDFLIENSGHRRNLEVDFFGGEPLLNFDVVKKLTLYGEELNEKYNKNIRFTITTNGTHLTDEIIDFINDHMSNVVLSLDGRKEINDKMRPNRGGKGSFDKVVPKFQDLIEKRGDKEYYVRGTFTNENLDFSKDAMTFRELGFDKISLEPVVTDPKEPYALREEHIDKIKEEYEKFAKIYLEENEKSDFLFYHFMMDLDEGPCLAKRSVGCGAGSEYLAITPTGDIYPCHQFVGKEEFKIGNLDEGIKNEDLREEFRTSNIFTKEDCSKCWAKFYCSGGCHANNYYNTGDLHQAYKMGCELEKKRIECAIAILASGDN